VCLCVYVCVFLFFWLHLLRKNYIYIYIREIIYRQNKGTSIWNLFPDSLTEPISLLFRRGTSIVVSAVNLVRTSHVHHSQRPRLFATRRPYDTAVRLRQQLRRVKKFPTLKRCRKA